MKLRFFVLTILAAFGKAQTGMYQKHYSSWYIDFYKIILHGPCSTVMTRGRGTTTVTQKYKRTEAVYPEPTLLIACGCW